MKRRGFFRRILHTLVWVLLGPRWAWRFVPLQVPVRRFPCPTENRFGQYTYGRVLYDGHSLMRVLYQDNRGEKR